MAPSSRYEEVELLEADRDTQRSCKRGRPFGIVVAMLAVLGVVGFASLPQTRFSAKQHLSVARKAFLKAFSPRSLAEAAQMKQHISLSLHQDGVPLATRMSMKATISKDEHPAEREQIVVDVNAEEGKADELKDALTKLINLMAAGGGHGGENSGEDGEDSGDGSGTPPPRRLSDVPEGQGDPPDGFDVRTMEDNSVAIVFPLPQDDKVQEEMEQSFETEPTFSASVEFGRTLEEMCEHNKEGIPMVFDGVKVEMDASFAATMAKVGETMDEEYGNPAMGNEVLMLQALSEMRTNIELAYRDPTELSDDLQQLFPPFQAVMGMLAQHIQGAPDEIKAAVKDLDGLSAGTRRIALEGLPNGYKIEVELSHFNLAPVLSNLIGALDA